MVPFFQAEEDGSASERGVPSTIGLGDIKPRKWNADGYFEDAASAAADDGLNPLVAAMMASTAASGGSRGGGGGGSGMNPLVAAMLAGSGAVPQVSTESPPRTPPRVAVAGGVTVDGNNGSPRFAWSTFQASPAPSAIPIPSWHRAEAAAQQELLDAVAAEEAAEAAAVVQSGGLTSMLKNMLGVSS